MKKIFILFILLFLSTFLFASGSVEDAKASLNNPYLEDQTKEQAVLEVTKTITSNDLKALVESESSQNIEDEFATTNSIFDSVYDAFESAFSLAIGNLKNNFLSSFLVLIIAAEIGWFAIQGILQKTMSIPEVLLKVFMIIVSIFIISNFQAICYWIRHMFSSAAVAATGNSTQAEYITTNGTFFGYGIKPSIVGVAYKSIMMPVEYLNTFFEKYLDILFLNSNVFTFFPLIGNFLLVAVTKLLLIIINIVLFVLIIFAQISAMLNMIEFVILITAALICLPWGIFKPTQFMSKGVFQAMFASCLKIFTIILITGLAQSIFSSLSANTLNPLYKLLDALPVNDGVTDFSQLKIPFGTTWKMCLSTIVCVLVYSYFLIKAPSIVSALLQGTVAFDTMGSHSIAQAGSTLVGAGLAVASGGVGATLGKGAGLMAGLFSGKKPSGTGGASDGATNGNKS